MEKQPEIENKERKTLKILVADDESSMRSIVIKTIRYKYPNAEIVPVVDGQQLLDALYSATSPFDLIISDNNMPRQRGIDALRTIKEDEHLKNIPFIMISYDTYDEKAEVLKLGARFLDKPFDVRELLTLVEELTSSKEGEG